MAKSSAALPSLAGQILVSLRTRLPLSEVDGRLQNRPQESERDDKWSFCLTAGTLCPANQEKQ
jgi:hypothetical protein